jgi:hypothetical protein
MSSVANVIVPPLSLMTILPVPLSIASLNVATRLLFGAIVPIVFTVIVGAAVSTVIAKTANPDTNLESGKSYYIVIASGVLTDGAGNNFAGINDSGTWAFSAASLSTTVAWSGANVSVTDSYINTSELSTATITGKQNYCLQHL